MTQMAQCATHGQARLALVCQHLVATFEDGVPRGAFWCRDEDGCINAYCRECSERLDAAGGEWVDEVVEHLDLKIICEGCFRRIASANGFSEID